MDIRPQDYHIGRRKPAEGVHIHLGEPTIVFITVCAQKRVPWITQPKVHKLLLETWEEAQAWLIGYYLLMPDHLHLFCAPHNLEIPLNRWMSYWKRLFTQKAKHPDWQWQPHHWDTRLRRSENYTEKWHYIRENPVKEGLVKNADDWPYQGMINVLPW